jgi:predicted GNAT family acetyltransferase
MSVRVTVTADDQRFSAAAAGLLAEHAECNVLATVLAGAKSGVYRGSPPLFAYGLGTDGKAVLAALRTPPWPLLVSNFAPGLAPALVSAWREQDRESPGVSGPTATARAVAAAWCGASGASSRCDRREAMHATQLILDPGRPAAGGLRATGGADRELLRSWMAAFVDEAQGLVGEHARAAVNVAVHRGGMSVWDVDGTPVCLVGMSAPVAGIARIGPVYTPPHCRRRGYASTAVAALSRQVLAAGAHTCMLLTDLDNPTPNRIYAELGFCRFADWEEHVFGG